MASKWVFIGGVENAPPHQELIAQKPYRSRVKEEEDDVVATFGVNSTQIYMS